MQFFFSLAKMPLSGREAILVLFAARWDGVGRPEARTEKNSSTVTPIYVCRPTAWQSNNNIINLPNRYLRSACSFKTRNFSMRDQ